MIQQIDPQDLGSKTFPLPLLINKLNRIGSGEAYKPLAVGGYSIEPLGFSFEAY